MSTYDLVGIGFGPSNLSLAIALEEHGGRALNAAFFEQKPALAWHRGMLLPDAKMQISFLKDLVSFRNPQSRFSFVSYLHEMGRLPQFVNNQDFFPTREEFHGYLEWAESNLADPVAYNSEVVSVRLPREAGGKGPAGQVQVEVRDTAGGGSRLVNARNIAVSTGLVPRMPVGVQRDERVWHSSEFLDRFRAWDPKDMGRVAVVGAGQSAAEIVRFLHDALPDASVTAVLSSYGYAIADNTPFANQVFDPIAVDDYYRGSEESKESIWQHHKNTNYSVVDDEVIKDLYRRAYDDEVRNRKRIDFINLARVDGVKRVEDETRVAIRMLATDEIIDLDVDVLICATGYNPMEPSRVLGELDKYCLRDERGRYRVERDYRLVTSPELPCGIYIQGGTEHTHGLSSSLLSNLAVRSGEIVESLAVRCN
ncbi:SidA/IucD/PvdA family monooxygenase [Streptomyces sp. NPDC041068]|uniref:lysine N(6)-hydroxylase/L-ornithine N(5)-oxygenase family protein n=1 Tax=Streptomyces sp. NPDC041068 TaxID=3155130 RepID=UPI0033C183BC